MTRENLILLTDSYKVSHHIQYPPNTEVVYSYIESRGGKWDQTVFFGLQYILKKYFVGAVVEPWMVDEAAEVSAAHFNNAAIFNRAGWEYILARYGGRLPLRIKAVPEGTVVNGRNVLVVIENTDPNCFWLTNYMETLLMQLWYPVTVATQSHEMKKVIRHYAALTGGDLELDFKLHDFGFRGSTSLESAAIGGAAHLTSFKGTDTMPALMLLRRYYGADMAGFSIPAAEHSTITSWGKSGEADAYRNMLFQFPNALVAVVSDSFDIFNACENLWGTQLKDAVESRNGTLVVRPDSGEPTVIVPQVLETLGRRFGYTVNAQGFKVLPSYIRVIQGDGIKYESLGDILEAVYQAGWCTDNIAFGSGGGLLQKVDRDTLKFACKASQVVVAGVAREVYKDPVTDPGKTSKKGRLVLVRDDDNFITVAEGTVDPNEDCLVTVFENGELLANYDLADIRDRIAANLEEAGIRKSAAA